MQETGEVGANSEGDIFSGLGERWMWVRLKILNIKIICRFTCHLFA
jgi:hypothetical protein